MVEPADKTPSPEERTVIDAAADLLQTIVDWLRQEGEAFVKNKVVLPLQRLGLTVFSAAAAATLLALGVVYISVASLLLLAEWLTWPGALYLIGGVLVVASAVFLYFKTRMVQK
jgi:uncharacterized protein (DUF486 family)